MLFTEQIFDFFLDEPKSSIPLANENAGFFGEGRSAGSLLNIEITFDMVGPSVAFSCTQRNAMFIYLKRTFAGGVSLRIGSINSNDLLLFHKSHA